MYAEGGGSAVNKPVNHDAYHPFPPPKKKLSEPYNAKVSSIMTWYFCLIAFIINDRKSSLWSKPHLLILWHTLYCPSCSWFPVFFFLLCSFGSPPVSALTSRLPYIQMSFVMFLAISQEPNPSISPRLLWSFHPLVSVADSPRFLLIPLTHVVIFISFSALCHLIKCPFTRTKLGVGLRKRIILPKL